MHSPSVSSMLQTMRTLGLVRPVRQVNTVPIVVRGSELKSTFRHRFFRIISIVEFIEHGCSDIAI